MKLGGIVAGHLWRGTLIGLVWLAPFKSAKHLAYKNTARDKEICTRQLRKECLVLAKGKFLKFKPMVLQDSGDSVHVIWAEPMAVRSSGTLWNRYFLKG